MINKYFSFYNLYFSPFKKKWPLILIAVFFIFFVLYAGYQKGLVHPIMRDFYGFWKAGWDFTHGCDLYLKIGYSPQFYYPPFAAMVFVVLSLMSYGTASFILYVINVFLLLVITEQVLRICNAFGIKNDKMRWPLFFAMVFSFRFYWATLDLFQVNAIVFSLTLTGVLAMLKNKNYLAVVMFILASFFKVIPVVFIVWLLIRRFSPKLLIFCLSFLIFLLLLPVPFRGWERGWNDIFGFFSLMQHVMTHMLNNNAYINQNLAASVMRLLTDTSENNATNVHLFFLDFNTARMITSIIWFSVFGYYIWLMYRLIKKTTQPSLFELCLVFIGAHLFSVFTWKAHLISMALIYIPFFLKNFRNSTLIEKSLMFFLYILIVICAFSGRAVLHTKLHILIASLNIFFYVVFGMFVYYAIQAEKMLKKHNY